MPPLARPTRPRHPCRRVASTSWRTADPAAKPPSPKASSGAMPSRPEQHRHDDAGHAEAGRPEQPLAQQLGRRLAPRQHGRDGHQDQQGEAERGGHAVEVRAAHRQPAVAAAPRRSAGTRCRAARRRRRARRARCWRGTRPPGRAASRSTRRPEAVTPPADQADRGPGGDEREEGQQVRRRCRTSENAWTQSMHAGAGEERAEDREAERGAQQRQVPDAQHPPALLHHHRVDVRGAGEPRQERRRSPPGPRPSTPPQPSTS